MTPSDNTEVKTIVEEVLEKVGIREEECSYLMLGGNNPHRRVFIVIYRGGKLVIKIGLNDDGIRQNKREIAVCEKIKRRGRCVVPEMVYYDEGREIIAQEFAEGETLLRLWQKAGGNLKIIENITEEVFNFLRGISEERIRNEERETEDW